MSKFRIYCSWYIVNFVSQINWSNSCKFRLTTVFIWKFVWKNKGVTYTDKNNHQLDWMPALLFRIQHWALDSNRHRRWMKRIPNKIKSINLYARHCQDRIGNRCHITIAIIRALSYPRLECAEHCLAGRLLFDTLSQLWHTHSYKCCRS